MTEVADESPLPDLPVTAILAELADTVSLCNRVILTAPPGAGKTTTVPLALLHCGLFDKGLILMLEPRRLAARHAAMRMAELKSEPLGETIGFHVRGEKKQSAGTRVLVVTEGILTRMLQSDPELAGVAVIIFDEFHERSLQADLGLALALQAQSLLRPELKVVIMSATLDTSRLSTLLEDAPVIESQGRMYPVETHYRPLPGQPAAMKGHRQQLWQQMVDVCIEAMQSHQGDVLGFLPGVREIREVTRLLQSRLQSSSIDAQVHAVYGAMSLEEQRRALQKSKDGSRRVVLATNIAQTSLTIEGITIVVDAGLARVARFDPAAGLDRMQTIKVSQDAAEQRRGRAGRLQDGFCYRLWSVEEHSRLTHHTDAEILHSDLAGLCLELAQWGVSEPEELVWLDCPPEKSMNYARQLLQQLDALDQQLKITPHGAELVKIPAPPRLSHMLLRARASGSLAKAGCIAALLSERDILGRAESVDLDLRVSVLNAPRVKSSALNPSGNATSRGAGSHHLKRVRDQARQLTTLASRTGTRGNAGAMELGTGELLALAYPERVAQNRGSGGRFLMANGKGAVLQEHDPLCSADWLVIANLDGQGRDARVFSAAEISLVEIEKSFGAMIQDIESVKWDPSLERVVAQKARQLGALVLSSKQIKNPDATLVDKAILAIVRQRGFNTLPFDKKSLLLMQRIRALSHHIEQDPELADLLDGCELPDLSQHSLLDSMEQWLLPHMNGKSRIEDLAALDWYGLLCGTMDWKLPKLVENLMPEKFVVPSGSSIRIDYSDDASPVLAVRLQELFGLDQTPAIMAGRVPLLLHLLSPGQRPIQLTRDLPGFWTGAYADVRKEMRSRYQKHYWPEDPLQAEATRKTKKADDRAAKASAKHKQKGK